MNGLHSRHFVCAKTMGFDSYTAVLFIGSVVVHPSCAYERQSCNPLGVDKFVGEVERVQLR